MNNWTIFFAHGKESGPWGLKIKRLAELATVRGIHVESLDYTHTMDPDKRVEQLLNSCDVSPDKLILVGSSMGGYVSTVASKVLNPKGLFLMAPAFFIGGYNETNPYPNSEHVEIIHGWNDDVVPAQNSISFAEKHHCILHLLDADHALNASIEDVCVLFDHFLNRVVGQGV